MPPSAPFSSKWIVLGALVLPCIFLPMTFAPFDFIEDSCLVYPTADSLSGLCHSVVQTSWEEFQRTGPFRPISWAHWQGAALVFGPDAFLWRVTRLLWCMATTALLLVLLREIGASAPASLATAGLAMWNPVRSEIWLQLGMPEAFAYPYALLAFIAALRAARSPQPLKWDLLGWTMLLLCLGIKNIFISLIPALVWFRLMAGERSWRDQLPGAIGYACLALLPVVHFLAVKWDPKPTHFATRFTLTQPIHYLRTLASAVSFLPQIPTLVVLLVCLHYQALLRSHAILIGAALLVVAGFGVYLPITEMYGRYTMPAVWGLDLIYALMLTALATAPLLARRLVAAGLVATMAFIGWQTLAKQDEMLARASMHWQTVQYLEAHQPGGRIVLLHPTEETTLRDVSLGECVHMIGHLRYRGRLQTEVAYAAQPEQADWLLSGQRFAPGPGYQMVEEFTGKRRLAGGEAFRSRLWHRIQE
jgi:hypothetical protein